MNIAAITRLKHGDLIALMRESGWNQSQLAHRSGLDPNDISRYVLLKNRPSLQHMQQIQRAFGEVGLFLDIEKAWPDQFQGLGRSQIIEQYRDVEPEALLPIGKEVLQLPAPCEVEESERIEAIKHALSKMKLSPKRRQVLTASFVDGLSDVEIEKQFGIPRQLSNYIKHRGWYRIKGIIEEEESGETFEQSKQIREIKSISKEVISTCATIPPSS